MLPKKLICLSILEVISCKKEAKMWPRVALSDLLCLNRNRGTVWVWSVSFNFWVTKTHANSSNPLQPSVNWLKEWFMKSLFHTGKVLLLLLKIYLSTPGHTWVTQVRFSFLYLSSFFLLLSPLSFFLICKKNKALKNTLFDCLGYIVIYGINGIS